MNVVASTKTNEGARSRFRPPVQDETSELSKHARKTVKAKEKPADLPQDGQSSLTTGSDERTIPVVADDVEGQYDGGEGLMTPQDGDLAAEDDAGASGASGAERQGAVPPPSDAKQAECEDCR